MLCNWHTNPKTNGLQSWSKTSGCQKLNLIKKPWAILHFSVNAAIKRVVNTKQKYVTSDPIKCALYTCIQPSAINLQSYLHPEHDSWSPLLGYMVFPEWFCFWVCLEKSHKTINFHCSQFCYHSWVHHVWLMPYQLGLPMRIFLVHGYT